MRRFSALLLTAATLVAGAAPASAAPVTYAFDAVFESDMFDGVRLADGTSIGETGREYGLRGTFHAIQYGQTVAGSVSVDEEGEGDWDRLLSLKVAGVELATDLYSLDRFEVANGAFDVAGWFPWWTEFKMNLETGTGSIFHFADALMAESDEATSLGYYANFTITDVSKRTPLPGCEPSGGVPPKCDLPAVPLPASIPMLATALAGMLAVGRTLRRRATSSA